MKTKRLAAIGIKRKGEKHFTTVGEVDAIYNGKKYKITAKKFHDGEKLRIVSPPVCILRNGIVI